MPSLKVLLIQSDMQTAQPLARYFSQRNDEVWQAWELGQAWALMDQVKPSLIFMDLHLAGSDWIGFIRRVRQFYPEIKIIMTNKYPDLQREMMAREQGIQVFLRQPFSARWIDQALQKANDDTQPLKIRRTGGEKKKEEDLLPKMRPVRVPVRLKITLPYLILALMFALGSSYIVSRVVLDSIQNRFMSQLEDTGRQTSDWMVREESRLLKTLRLVANTQGVAEAVQRRDAEELRDLLLPVVVNAGEETVVVLDPSGTSVLSLMSNGDIGSNSYSTSRGETIFAAWDFVQQVANRSIDSNGDKFAGLARAPWGDYFYISGPILNAQGELAGIVLVGKSLETLVYEMNAEAMGSVTLYDLEGHPMASTLSPSPENAALPSEILAKTLAGQDTIAPVRDVSIESVGYTEILAPWEVRGGSDLGVMGVSLAQAFLVSASRVTQMQIFVLVSASVLLVLIIGLYLSGLITRPLNRLVMASSEVAQGNLEIKVDAAGDDEVAVLAQSFNYMVAGLQEGSIYRDLLGRTVSPEVREQLRQTFTSGNLRLEGQQAVATVLMTDIRGFTPISEQADAATVFQWLNEYFAQVVPIVASHGGVVNKFDGDAMLAFFGILPRLISPKQSAQAACQAALEILQAIDKFNDQRARRGLPPLVTGVGVHTGPVTAGGLGTSDRLHYTIIGDTVNTTQRIESVTRNVMDCSGILVSQSTVNALGGSAHRMRLLPIGAHSLKGKSEPIPLYQLVGSEDIAGGK